MFQDASLYSKSTKHSKKIIIVQIIERKWVWSGKTHGEFLISKPGWYHMDIYINSFKHKINFIHFSFKNFSETQQFL